MTYRSEVKEPCVFVWSQTDQPGGGFGLHRFPLSLGCRYPTCPSVIRR